MTTIPLAQLVIKLSAMLAASLFVERFLVIFNSFINRLFLVQSSLKYLRIEELENAIGLEEKAKREEELLLNSKPRQVVDSLIEIEAHPDLPLDKQKESHFEIKEILSIEDNLNSPDKFELLKKVNNIRKEFWMQLLGSLIAIAGCFYAEFSIWIFITNIQTGVPINDIEPSFWEFIFTGIIIGAGSKPINFLMNFLVNRKIEMEKEVINEKEETPSNTGDGINKTVPNDKKPNQTSSIEEIVGFSYNGGDRPERLERTHLFRSPIDLIVYHHTAMHSDASFNSLVKEFDRKGWLTGYNCVVFKDGSIKALCRWDRFGNHALPHNGHSLGIALQGNFETKANVPFANHDGSFGIQSPTQKQIEGLSKITALWSILHDIPLQFSVKEDGKIKGILPHNSFAKKACPGNNFPYEAFKKQVLRYHKLWQHDKSFNDALEVFKEMPYVMPKI